MRWFMWQNPTGGVLSLQGFLRLMWCRSSNQEIWCSLATQSRTVSFPAMSGRRSLVLKSQTYCLLMTTGITWTEKAETEIFSFLDPTARRSATWLYLETQAQPKLSAQAQASKVMINSRFFLSNNLCVVKYMRKTKINTMKLSTCDVPMSKFWWFEEKTFTVAFAAIDCLRKSRKPLGEQIEERLREKGLIWTNN